MSSAFEVLKKSHNTRAPPFREKSSLVPERKEKTSQDIFDGTPSSLLSTPLTEDQADDLLLEDVLADITKDRKKLPDSIKNQMEQFDLNQKMVATIRTLEQKVKQLIREGIEKDKKIRDLEEKNKCNVAQERSNVSVNSATKDKVSYLENRCEVLELQISEMEDFLADYGMIWVGEDAEDSNSSSDSGPSDDDNFNEQTDMVGILGQTWNPRISAPKFQPQYDKILENIEELNQLVGADQLKIMKTDKLAKFQVAEAIKLCFYANGIFLYDGPFRSFEDAPTRQFVLDLTDGYFPSELQSRYPDGVPLRVTDKRDVQYSDHFERIFAGKSDRAVASGRSREEEGDASSSAESQSKPSGVSRFGTSVSASALYRESSAASSDKTEHLLNTLPRNVVKSGKVVSIRSDLSLHLGIPSTNNEETPQSTARSANRRVLVQTDLLNDLKERANGQNDATSNIKMVSLRVKNEKGNETYVLKMKATDTIAEVRASIDKHRKSRTTSKYEIVAPFPECKVLSQETKTLEQYGLVPSATLCLRLKKTPPSLMKR